MNPHPAFIFSADNRIVDLLHHHPDAFLVLNGLGIQLHDLQDVTVADAAASIGMDKNELLEHLALTLPSTPLADGNIDCAALALDELIDYIETYHHSYTKRELARLRFLVARCAELVNGSSAHSDTDNERVFDNLRNVIHDISNHLLSHLAEEETLVFPIGRLLEQQSRERSIAHDDCERELRAIEHDHGVLYHDLDRLQDSIVTTSWTEATADHRSAIVHAVRNLTADLEAHSRAEEEFLIPAIAYADELLEQRSRHLRQAGHSADQV